MKKILKNNLISYCIFNIFVINNLFFITCNSFKQSFFVSCKLMIKLAISFTYFFIKIYLINS